MRYYCFLDIKGRFSPELLEPVRTDLFALCDDDGRFKWYVPLQNDEEAGQFAEEHQLSSFFVIDLQDCVDWGMQWSIGREWDLHTSEGSLERLTIDLTRICPTALTGACLTLLPGPGFGDLSHPTTRLSLKMLAPCVQGAIVWDIGCGSGILSLAALKLGASIAYGIDIDHSALEHAARNAAENGLLERCRFCHPNQHYEGLKLTSESIVVMNMIRSEQENVWEDFSALSTFHGTLITSGILKEEHLLYLKLCERRGLVVQEEHTEGDWMAFRFKSEDNLLKAAHARL